MAADPHHTTTADVPPMSDAELLADRQRGWDRFCRFMVWSIAGTVLTLVFLAIFVA